MITQTITTTNSDRPGNCLSAAVATFLNKPLEEVPHFVELGIQLGDAENLESASTGNAWWSMLIGYMAGHGYWPLELASLDEVAPDEIAFVMGMSPRGVCHQVLYRNGDLWHDPHPSRAGVDDIREVLVWRPTRHNHDPKPGA